MQTEAMEQKKDQWRRKGEKGAEGVWEKYYLVGGKEIVLDSREMSTPMRFTLEKRP
jgi:hypothetical protein